MYMGKKKFNDRISDGLKSIGNLHFKHQNLQFFILLSSENPTSQFYSPSLPTLCRSYFLNSHLFMTLNPSSSSSSPTGANPTFIHISSWISSGATFLFSFFVIICFLLSLYVWFGYFANDSSLIFA